MVTTGIAKDEINVPVALSALRDKSTGTAAIKALHFIFIFIIIIIIRPTIIIIIIIIVIIIIIIIIITHLFYIIFVFGVYSVTVTP